MNTVVERLVNRGETSVAIIMGMPGEQARQAAIRAAQKECGAGKCKQKCYKCEVNNLVLTPLGSKPTI